ncbi:MAG TPA: alpha/beta fold hydrolase [Candidatus Eremiobacteraceae bacterium]|nr:alpha/beta fold hydrolase [Candidatus Eremiobacteraceae bacterium]
MRAREPDASGYVSRGAVSLYYEIFGTGSPTVLFLPTWSLVHSRVWKAQIPYFARHFRALTFDGRGNGKSSRPVEPAAYSRQEFADDAIAVMDATKTEKAIVVGFSMSGVDAAMLAADHPTRVAGVVFICPVSPFGEALPERKVSWNDELSSTDGWAKHNRHYWLRDYEGWLRFFAGKLFTEPHSTKQIEDIVGWGRETTPEILIATYESEEPASSSFADATKARDAYKRIRCPVLVIHGSDDAVISQTSGAGVAEATNGALVVLQGAGHAPHARDPVKVNLVMRAFAESAEPSHTPLRRWPRGNRRRKRALYISSPIGLGHAQRDVSIARELRRIRPDLEIDWLAQDPVTRVLAAEGEHIHPASRFLASESKHIESESAEHDLHAFQAIRNMDEILVNNFMVFHDIVRDEPYDLWIGDEAWELDYYLHENPEEKRAPFVWMTDFVGWIPMPDGGERERVLTADYNAEMIEQIARYPSLRDRSIFVGNFDDVVGDRFGPDLPLISEWTKTHFDFSGYITGFDPAQFVDRAQLRAELGYSADETVCIVTVGGSGVGAPLLRRVIDSYPFAKQRVPSLRMIVVAGPRIDAASLPTADGLEVKPYVHELYRHLAACDIAIVQGGLSTTMELAASRRPFLYFPLRHHFEQNFHVRHRLERYGAGRHMDYEVSTPEVIAAALAEELGKAVTSKPVESDGAARAASRIAELI